MTLLKKFFPLLVLALALAFTGCSSVTNLTPRNYARTPDNLYHFELKLESRQQSMIWETIKPVVQIGDAELPMERVHRMSDRWQATVPLPAKPGIVYYRYKVYFEYYDFNHRGADTILSSPYKIEVK
ncbi:MAG: hypothetical protein HY301_09265 [Verrucomicrobia bacterium]|nr:hypothetical protein [Verrucomicrobiota bacterium]